MLMLTTKLEHEQWEKMSHIIGSHVYGIRSWNSNRKLVRFRDPLDWDGEPDYQKMSPSMFGTTRPTRPYQEWSRGRQPQYSWKSAIGGRLDSEIGQNLHAGWLTGDRPTTRISVSACFSMTKRTKSYKVGWKFSPISVPELYEQQECNGLFHLSLLLAFCFASNSLFCSKSRGTLKWLLLRIPAKW